MFLTSRHRGLVTGGLVIRDRRRKPDEPFNPFAANANQVRQKKRNERSQGTNPHSPSHSRPAPRQNTNQDELRKKQEEARRRSGSTTAVSTPTVQKPAVESSALNAATTVDAKPSVSRADRLAELRKQSQESVKKTESILEPTAAEPETIQSAVVVPTEEIQTEIYQIGKDYKFENLRDWFKLIYQVLFGKDDGPRFGTFISIYGIDKTIDLIRERAKI